MTANAMTTGSKSGRALLRWFVVAALLSLPWATQVGTQWKPIAFLLAGGFIIGCMLVYEFAAGRSASAAYRAGVAVAGATSFLIVWINVAVGIVDEDDPANLGYFLTILMAMVGAFAAAFRASGLVRAMLGVAAVQMILALIVATAPSTEHPLGVTIISSFFGALWLISAGCFRKAAAARAG